MDFFKVLPVVFYMTWINEIIMWCQNSSFFVWSLQDIQSHEVMNYYLNAFLLVHTYFKQCMWSFTRPPLYKQNYIPRCALGSFGIPIHVRSLDHLAHFSDPVDSKQCCLLTTTRLRRHRCHRPNLGVHLLRRSKRLTLVVDVGRIWQ